jgi:hypothetical protein
MFGVNEYGPRRHEAADAKVGTRRPVSEEQPSISTGHERPQATTARAGASRDLEMGRMTVAR